MSRRLPPLNALRAFEAAARHLSFRKAAEELHVTPAAISQQIRALEEHCGTPLFRRLTRALALTEAGRAAAPLMREGFDRLEAAVAAMRPGRDAGRLTVSVAPSFAAKWLVPRLDRFRARHPDHDVRIDATNELARFGADGVDIALRYGRGDYPGLRADCLMSDVPSPVCAPRLTEGERGLRQPQDLRHHTLLHVHWKMEQDAAPNWRMWLRAAGVEGVDAERGPQFSVDSMAVQAAIEGHGVALAGRALVEDDLRAGRLVRPFCAGPEQKGAEFSYWLVYPGRNAEIARVAAFRAWVLEEVARDLAAPAAP